MEIEWTEMALADMADLDKGIARRVKQSVERFAETGVPLCSTTELCRPFQPLALKPTGKILKPPRTSAAVEIIRQDSGEELKPLRARREMPAFSHSFVISPVFARRLSVSHRFSCFCASPHALSILLGVSQPISPAMPCSAWKNW